MIDQHSEIAFNREIRPGILILGLKSPAVARESRPGQFVMVRVNDGIDPLLRRPFSICGVSDGDIVRILYRVIGHGTEILAKKKAGERLSIMGPLGQGFNLPAPKERPVLVAGGMGIAPLFFLASYLKNQQMEFMSGFATSGDILPQDRITDLPLNISVATDDGSEGYPGMVTGLLDEHLKKHINEKDLIRIYACGPMPMLKAVSLISDDLGITCQVSLESLMACGIGVCQGCAVRITSPQDHIDYRHVCKDGPVFQSHVIDWSGI